MADDTSRSAIAGGLLTGFAFAAFYVTAGIPIARMADRMNRRNIVAAALFIWSFMTAISGLAQNYWQLLLARIGVGVGEEFSVRDAKKISLHLDLYQLSQPCASPASSPAWPRSPPAPTTSLPAAARHRLTILSRRRSRASARRR